MAIRAAQKHHSGRVHGWLVGLRVAGNASGALAIRFGLRLAHQARTHILIGCSQCREWHSGGYDDKKKARRQRAHRKNMSKTIPNEVIVRPFF